MKYEKVDPATGAAGPGFSRGTNKYSGNMNQKGNPDALINKGQGPRGGGTSVPYCSDMISGSKHPQKRQAVGDGSTTSMPNRGKESFNYGRGPLKGNA